MAKKPIVIWTEVWADLDAWEEFFQFRCDHCDHYREIATVEERRWQIEELVEKQLERNR